MTKPPKPDLTDHEEEDIPFDDVMRRLLEAKATPKKSGGNGKAEPKAERDEL